MPEECNRNQCRVSRCRRNLIILGSGQHDCVDVTVRLCRIQLAAHTVLLQGHSQAVAAGLYTPPVLPEDVTLVSRAEQGPGHVGSMCVQLFRVPAEPVETVTVSCCGLGRNEWACLFWPA